MAGRHSNPCIAQETGHSILTKPHSAICRWSSECLRIIRCAQCVTKDFLRTVRELNVTPHVTKNDNNRASNPGRRTNRPPGYAINLSRRWLMERSFGWLKQTGPLRQTKLRGLSKVDWLFVFSCAAHNLLRLPRLLAHQLPPTLREQCA
jgi:hypothetical protein